MTQTLNIKRLALITLAVASFLASFYFLADISIAQNDPKDVACTTIGNLTGDTACQETDPDAGPNAVSNIGKTIVDTLSAIAAAVAVIFLIVGGIRYMTSAGNPEKAKAAKGTITAALIGLVIVLATQFIINTVVDFTDDAIEGATDDPGNGSGIEPGSSGPQ